MTNHPTDQSDALLEALHALERLRDLTPARANETTAGGLYGAVNAIAASAVERLTPALAFAARPAGEVERLQEALERIRYLRPAGDVNTCKNARALIHEIERIASAALLHMEEMKNG